MIEVNVRILVALVAGKASGRQAFGQVRNLRNLDALLVQIGAASLLRCEQLIARRIINHAGNSPVLVFQPQGNAEYWKPVREVGGAIERVHVPAIVTAGIDQALLFTEDIVARPTRFDPLPDQNLRLAIRHGDQVRVALVLHLYVLLEVSHQQGAGFAGDIGHSKDEVVLT